MRALFFLPLATGCAVRVAGEVDGEGVGGARDAIYGLVTYDWGLGEVTQVWVVLSEVAETCAYLDAAWDIDELECDDYCEEFVAVNEEYLGAEEYWDLSIVFYADDEDEVVDTFDQSDSPETGDFQAVFERVDTTDWYDPDACEDACEDDDLWDDADEDADDGFLEITSLEDDVLTGNFEIEFGGDDALKGSFSATQCDALEGD